MPTRSHGTGRTVRNLTVQLEINGRPYPFQLKTRPLTLGTPAQVQYYWMDSTRFRISRAQRPRADPAACRSIVGYFWECVRAAGSHRDRGHLATLLLAASYPLVSADKGPQDIYRDAHLRAGRTAPTKQGLPDDVRARIRDVVSSRDADRVRSELDAVLGGDRLSERDARLVQRTFDGIVEQGVDWVLQDDQEGLQRFLGKFDAWLANQRRRGGNGGWRRALLNHASYAAKVSFYHCYGIAWSALIPWLGEHRGLDPVSERFLRFWHHPDQPLERADGQILPGVFGGQVLALHPLSGFFMLDPALCAVAGTFFGTEAHDRVFVHGQRDCPEYWNLIGAILAAAHLYRQAQEAQEAGRGTKEKQLVDEPTVAARTESNTGLLEEMLACGNRHCGGCGGTLRVAGFHPAADADVGIDVACPACRRTDHLWIPGDEIKAWTTARAGARREADSRERPDRQSRRRGQSGAYGESQR